MQTLKLENFADYELIDCGDFEKLERFGQYITIRPEPQAVWNRVLDYKEWEKLAHVKFMPKSSSSGEWKKLKQMPEQWPINYTLPNKQKITFRLGLTSFKHVGVFPEQAINWNHICEKITDFSKQNKSGDIKFLNLFAYTGGASLAAKAAGADVYHVDSIKQVITWGRQNMEMSNLNDIRWVVEDALKFVQREIKRGNKYHGIILDPPAYGHGPNGEKWKLEDMIQDLIAKVIQLLHPENHFLILNSYSLGFSSLIIENLLKQNYNGPNKIEVGEIFIPSKSGVKLPLGVWGRI